MAIATSSPWSFSLRAAFFSISHVLSLSIVCVLGVYYCGFVWVCLFVYTCVCKCECRVRVYLCIRLRKYVCIMLVYVCMCVCVYVWVSLSLTLCVNAYVCVCTSELCMCVYCTCVLCWFVCEYPLHLYMGGRVFISLPMVFVCMLQLSIPINLSRPEPGNRKFRVMLQCFTSRFEDSTREAT